jgi:pyridoxal/pyridoxine/pyridoxamine kinase
MVHSYVGNTMATFVMQSLGCEVCAMNTVNYSTNMQSLLTFLASILASRG